MVKFYLIPTFFVFLMIFFVFLTKGIMGIILGIILCVVPVYYWIKLSHKYSDKIAIIILMAMCALSFFVLNIYTNYHTNTIFYKEYLEDYKDRDYETIISRIYNNQRLGFSFTRLDKLKDKAINEWIIECKKTGEMECVYEMADLAYLDFDVKYEMEKAFDYTLDEYLEREEMLEALKIQEEINNLHDKEPYVGMDEEYINITSWGTSNVKIVRYNEPRSDTTTYSWYNCENGRQFTRSVDVSSGKVFYISPSDIGVEVDRCSK